MDMNSIEFSVLVCLMSLAAGMLGGMILGHPAGFRTPDVPQEDGFQSCRAS
jgi:hypothetical protein